MAFVLRASLDVKVACVCRTLEVLQDQVEPGPVEDVAEVLQRELGAPPSHLFAEFEPEARAAASLAQVSHKQELRLFSCCDCYL